MKNVFETWGNGLSDARAFLDHYENDVFLPCDYCPFERSYHCQGDSCIFIKNQALNLVNSEVL